jgi:hypothetical protein
VQNPADLELASPPPPSNHIPALLLRPPMQDDQQNAGLETGSPCIGGLLGLYGWFPVCCKAMPEIILPCYWLDNTIAIRRASSYLMKHLFPDLSLPAVKTHLPVTDLHFPSCVSFFSRILLLYSHSPFSSLPPAQQQHVSRSHVMAIQPQSPN